MPWTWSKDPTPAYRGAGAWYTVFQATSKDYAPKYNVNPITNKQNSSLVITDNQSSKLVKTKKGELLLVPCSCKEDEKLMFITLRGGFHGWYSRLVTVNAEIIYSREGNDHACPTKHLIVRIIGPQGYVLSETGQKSGSGIIEIFSWSKGYQQKKLNPNEKFK